MFVSVFVCLTACVCFFCVVECVLACVGVYACVQADKLIPSLYWVIQLLGNSCDKTSLINIFDKCENA